MRLCSELKKISFKLLKQQHINVGKSPMILGSKIAKITYIFIFIHKDVTQERSQ